MAALFAPMAILIAYPWLAALVGAALLALGWRRGARPARWVGGLWLAYAAYETGMRLRWLCHGECNIRIDLLLIYPTLLLLTLGALAAALRRPSAP